MLASEVITLSVLIILPSLYCGHNFGGQLLWKIVVSRSAPSAASNNYVKRIFSLSA